MNVTRGGGGEAAKGEIKDQIQPKERLRPAQGLRHELKGD